MLDLILAVDDPLEFHSQNLSLHPSHYSMLPSLLGPHYITWLQCDTGANVYFNPLVSMTFPTSMEDDPDKNNNNATYQQQRLIKYGVVQTDDLLRDLKQWDFLYLAGRMQKPTLLIQGDDRILEAQYDYNLKYALSASLLLLSESKENENHTENEAKTTSIPIHSVFEQIARLSYSGDPRMAVGGEDPHKIEKLVHSPGQYQRFLDLYQHQLSIMEQLGVFSLVELSSSFSNNNNNNNKLHIEWNPKDDSMRKLLWERLPPRLQKTQQLALLGGAIASVVAPAAIGQSLKGMLTAGIGRSIRYAGAKFAKGRSSKS